MSTNAISSNDFIRALQQPRAAGRTGSAGNAAGNPPASFAVRLAEFKAQTLGAMIAPNGGGITTTLQGINPGAGSTGAASDPLSALSALTAPGSTKDLSPTGRNTALFDPESAYSMMTAINGKEVAYKAQFSEMSEMQSAVAGMQQEGARLGRIDASTDAAGLKARLQEFVQRFNAWDERFDPDMQSGGILNDTQAAEVARHELRASIQNPFIGAEHGLHGLRDLGITIDDATGQAAIDPAQLDAALSRNPTAAAQTVQAFGAHFARSAELLNSEGNFIPNRLKNLDRVIGYIDKNSSALQAEFGRGDPARPTGQIAAALAAYKKNHTT